MMDIRPLLTSPDPLNSSLDTRSLHSVFAPREASTMIIDATNHNSSTPVSPKQGETITADTLSKQEPELVSSSLTPMSWEPLPSQPKQSLSSTTSVLNQSWKPSSPRSSPVLPTKAVKDAVIENYQAKTEELLESWSNGSVNPTTTSSPHIPPSPSTRREMDESEKPSEASFTTTSNSKLSGRICDRRGSSQSPHSHLNSSFDESGQAANVGMQNTDRYSAGSMSMFGGFERRSRRKPTIGDIVRRVRPPVDAPPYDSEESEIEDDILRDELMAKMGREHENDEVDGMTKSSIKISDDEGFREDSRHFTVERLSRLEAVDGIKDDVDDEEMEVNSESDSMTEFHKQAFLKDVPPSICDLMEDVKVKAHEMLLKTNCLPPSDAKLRRDQYLLHMLSDLRDSCQQVGLKADIIGAILKFVETEVTYLSEDLETKQYFSDSDKESSYNGMDANESHFLSRPDVKLEEKHSKDSSGLESSYSVVHPPSFFHQSSAPSPLPITSSTSPSPTSDSKPIIVTVSADAKLSSPLITARGLPLHHPLASNISDHSFGPMFPNGKLGSWFPSGLVNSMAMYSFNSPGHLDHVFNRKFINLEGKIGENVDKDYLKCQFCERTFRRQKNLENHVENTHQGKGPLKPRRETNDMYFKCSHCPYTTKHQSNLYVHLRIHTGERPYICGACGVQYSQSHSLKSHIINKHDGIMSYYIKEKRTRSPRGMGYLATQVMHESNLFKLPGAMMGSPMHHNNLDIVNKAIEYATSENAKHQQQLKQQQQQQQHFSPGSDNSGSRNMMPPPLASTISSDNISINGSNSNNLPSSIKSPATPSSGPANGHDAPTHNNNPVFSTPPTGPHPPFFMNGHPLMFGELPPHIRNPPHIGSGHHPQTPHPFLPGFPHFSSNSGVNYHGAVGLSPLPGLSPESSPSLSTPNSHQTPHLQLPASLSHLTSSPLPLLQQQQQHIKKEPHNAITNPMSPKQIARGQSDEAIDLRKKSPPLDTKEPHAHGLSTCGGKENCPYAAKLKYLRLNVVRMLGILVPNLNFAEKGISAESESVDELLQDVIECNTRDDELE